MPSPTNQQVMRDWMTLFKSGLPLEPPGLDTPHIEELPEAAEEEAEAPAPADADAAVNTAELDSYLSTGKDEQAAGSKQQPAPSHPLTHPLTLPPSHRDSCRLGCA